MIRHIVMFKLINTNDSRIKLEIKEQLMALPKIIKEIKFYQVGLNISKSPNALDMVLVSDFESENELSTYSKHPEHQKVLKLISENTSERKVVDFIVD